MRVIAGSARRLPLRTVPGMETRPTTDRIKETLFNILQNDLPGARFLDIFAGSGQMGIEALSRGASKAYFIENNKAAADCIRENLAFTHLEGQAELMQCDVLAACSRLAGEAPFHIIFMDPPYGKEMERTVLTYFSEHRPSFVTPETVIIAEAAKHTDISYMAELGYEILRIKEYKTNMHVFLKQKEQG